MKAFRAHVLNGQIVLDEPADDLTAVDRVELDAALEESAAQLTHGELEDAHAFASRLVSRS